MSKLLIDKVAQLTFTHIIIIIGNRIPMMSYIASKQTHNNIIYTSLQVLLHDPLYMWTISPIKSQNLQRSTRDNCELTVTTNNSQNLSLSDSNSNQQATSSRMPSNKMAERVLLRLQEKLEGIEDGTLLSVTGQVNHLIQEAMNPHNLCQLFPGWQPWI